MALNLTNLGRKIATYATLANPVPTIAGRKITNWVSRPGFVQGATNYLGGINDTMALPAATVWDAAALLAPSGSRMERGLKDLRDEVIHTTDMGQEYSSIGNILGRLTPGAMLAIPMAAASAPAAPALGAPAVIGLEAPSLSTIGSYLREMPGIFSTWADRREGVRQRRQPQVQYIQPQYTQPQVKVSAVNRNVEARNKIVNALRSMKNNGQLATNLSQTRKLINLYNRTV